MNGQDARRRYNDALKLTLFYIKEAPVLPATKAAV
jgi:hypothetical protein